MREWEYGRDVRLVLGGQHRRRDCPGNCVKCAEANASYEGLTEGPATGKASQTPQVDAATGDAWGALSLWPSGAPEHRRSAHEPDINNQRRRRNTRALAELF